jgi:endonuclease/exonuclease/phosphatase family metal-dependent hydrolase
LELRLRSWNAFHGNTVPPGRRAHLGELIRRAVADSPDLVCLQEVPVWALPRLERWAGMTAVGDVGAPPRLGPLPSPPGVGRALTALHQGLLRSALTGQANAILIGDGLAIVGHEVLVLNDRRFRHAQARWLGLGALARLAWANERRICQVLRIRVAGGASTLTLGHLHATSFPPDERLADAEVFRAAVFLDAFAAPHEPCVLAGDLNVREGRSRTLADLTADEWGFAHFGHRVDHVLVRGAELVGGTAWPEERRRLGSRLLSDHAPIEVRLRVR